MAFGWFKKKGAEAENQPSDKQAAKEQGTEELPVQAAAETETATTEKVLPVDPESDQNPAADTIPPEVEVPVSAADDQEPEDSPAVEETGEKKPGGFFKRLKNGLAKTRKVLTTDIDELFTGKVKVDDEMLEDLEELLITADLGVQTTMGIIERLRKNAPRISGPEDLKEILKNEIRALLDVEASTEEASVEKPYVTMVIGVNGVGKTTTIGKLAAKANAAGQKILIAAADTFRAAAIEQLTIWAERADADIVKHRENSDPAAVAFDSVEAAIARGSDQVIIDTAGRLHTKVNLMEELKKIKRSVSKKLDGAPHETLLVLDATTGQNALSQAKLFNEAMDITGLALTKLDGTAKGGIVVAICSTLKIPLKYIGVGEQIDDLQAFDPERFVDALF